MWRSLLKTSVMKKQTGGNTHKNITPERCLWSETPQGTFKITSLSVVNMLFTQYAEYLIVSAVFVFFFFLSVIKSVDSEICAN